MPGTLDELSQTVEKLLAEVVKREQMEPEPGSPMGRKLEALRKQLETAYQQQRQGRTLGTSTMLAPTARPVTALDFSQRQPTPVYRRSGAVIAPSENWSTARAVASGPIPDPSANLSDARMRLRLEAHMRGAPAGEQPRLQAIIGAMGQRPAGVGQDEWMQALARVEQQLYEEKEKQLQAEKKKTQDTIAAQAYFARTGKVAQSQVSIVPQEPGPSPTAPQSQTAALLTSLMVRSAITSLPSATNQLVTFNRPTYGNEMAPIGRAGSLLQSTFGQLPGPLGIAANLAGAFGQAISAIGEAFKRYQPTLQEEISLLRERQGLTRASRSTGAVDAEGLRAAFQGTDVVERLSTRPGQPVLTAQQRAVTLRGAVNQARAALNTMNPEELAYNRDRVERILTQARNRARQAQDPLEGRTYDQFRNILSMMGARQADQVPELERFQNRAEARTLTDQQIRHMAEQMTTGVFTRLQTRVQLGGDVLRLGILPNLRPGAPQLSEMPALFQSRQSDVLDIHAQVQQDAIRDQRQEARFQAEMRLRQEILDAIRSLRFAPVMP